MHTFLRSALFPLFTTCVLLLSGCSFLLTTENGDPYTTGDIVFMLEREFAAVHPHIVVVSTEVEQEKPFQRNIYHLYDETHQISFSCMSVVKYPTLPFPGAQRDTDADFQYADAYSRYINDKLVPIAAAGNIRLATVKEGKELEAGKLKMTVGNGDQISLFHSIHYAFVNADTKGGDMAKLCRQFYQLYRPDNDDALLDNLGFRDITFYYLPSGESDLKKGVYLTKFYINYNGETEWDKVLRNYLNGPHDETDTDKLEKNLEDRFQTIVSEASAKEAKGERYISVY